MIGVSHFYWRFSGSWVPWGINQQNTITTKIHSSYLQLKSVNCAKTSALWDALRYISLVSTSNSGNKSNSLSVCIRSFPGPCFSAFGMNTERYFPYSVRMRENADQKTPNTDIWDEWYLKFQLSTVKGKCLIHCCWAFTCEHFCACTVKLWLSLFKIFSFCIVKNCLVVLTINKVTNWDGLHNSVQLVEFQKKHPLRNVTFSKVAGWGQSKPDVSDCLIVWLV